MPDWVSTTKLIPLAFLGWPMARLVFLLLLLMGSVAAQGPTFRSQTNLVQVPTLVKGGDGRAVYGLEAKDFVVEDDGIEQAVALDEEAESEPVSLVIAIERGGRAAYEFPRIEGLASMLDPLMSEGLTQVAIVEFDSQVELKRDFTTDEGVIRWELKDLQAGNSGAAILDAVYFSEKLLEQVPANRQRVLLLVSETRDHGSIWAKKINQVVNLVGSRNTSMYALTFSPSRSNILDTMRGNNTAEMHEGPDLLAPIVMGVQAMRKNSPKAVAAMTGGEYETFSTRDGFENRMLDFTNHLHSRYLLSFVPKDPHPGMHSIRVTLKRPETGKVLARSSYWALGGGQ
jgi:VWFA-related protein